MVGLWLCVVEVVCDDVVVAVMWQCGDVEVV